MESPAEKKNLNKQTKNTAQRYERTMNLET